MSFYAGPAVEDLKAVNQVSIEELRGNCSWPVRIYWKRYCTTPGISIGVGGSGSCSKILKFYAKYFFHAMGKVL